MNDTNKAAIQQILDLNHLISHNLQAITLLLDGANNLTPSNAALLRSQSEEAIANFSRFRDGSYNLLGINEKEGQTAN